jgi:hypothetical protein
MWKKSMPRGLGPSIEEGANIIRQFALTRNHANGEFGFSTEDLWESENWRNYWYGFEQPNYQQINARIARAKKNNYIASVGGLSWWGKGGTHTIFEFAEVMNTYLKLRKYVHNLFYKDISKEIFQTDKNLNDSLYYLQLLEERMQNVRWDYNKRNEYSNLNNQYNEHYVQNIQAKKTFIDNKYYELAKEIQQTQEKEVENFKKSSTPQEWLKTNFSNNTTLYIQQIFDVLSKIPREIFEEYNETFPAQNQTPQNIQSLEESPVLDIVSPKKQHEQYWQNYFNTTSKNKWRII